MAFLPALLWSGCSLLPWRRSAAAWAFRAVLSGGLLLFSAMPGFALYADVVQALGPGMVAAREPFLSPGYWGLLLLGWAAMLLLLGMYEPAIRLSRAAAARATRIAFGAPPRRT